MSSFPSRPDVVVIGAGAAGIAAGRHLRHLGVDAVLVEARGRIGGRAHTGAGGTAHAFDLGCEWLHSADRNILASLAEELGFRLDRTEPSWRRHHVQHDFDETDHALFDREQDAFYDRLAEAAHEARRSGEDRPASELLDPDARWNGFIDAISTYYNGAPLSRVSVLDFDAYVDTEVNWRVLEGYGTMIVAAGAGLPVRLGCRVTRVDGSRRSLRVETDAGTIETSAVIVTVPTGVLATGAIRFDPALDDQMAAAAGLPLGLADKVFLGLANGAGIAADTRLIGDPTRLDTGVYTLRPAGRPVVECYFGGDYARHLEQGGDAAFYDAARREIASALGRDVGAALTPIVATAWGRDPFALGSYSHALPGHAGARATLAIPVDERILFAGEATSPHFFSTAHGAFEEGLKAARAVAQALTPAGRVAGAGARR